MLRFTRDHEWLKIEGDIATVGITGHAAEQLGEVVFVELPVVGTSFAQGDGAAVVESVKAASDVYAPVSGEITEVNEVLSDNPEKVNEDPAGEGWFFRIRLTDASQTDSMMDDAAYKAMIG